MLGALTGDCGSMFVGIRYASEVVRVDRALESDECSRGMQHLYMVLSVSCFMNYGLNGKTRMGGNLRFKIPTSPKQR